MDKPWEYKEDDYGGLIVRRVPLYNRVCTLDLPPDRAGQQRHNLGAGSRWKCRTCGTTWELADMPRSFSRWRKTPKLTWWEVGRCEK